MLKLPPNRLMQKPLRLPLNSNVGRHNPMIIDPFRITTDPEIAEAEQKLDFRFPFAHIEFLKSGREVANAVFESAVIFPGCSYLDIFEIAATAWNHDGAPEEWLSFIEDNGDCFCVSQTGEVRYWSHNGVANEKWPNFSAWFQRICVERR